MFQTNSLSTVQSNDVFGQCNFPLSVYGELHLVFISFPVIVTVCCCLSVANRLAISSIFESLLSAAFSWHVWLTRVSSRSFIERNKRQQQLSWSFALWVLYVNFTLREPNHLSGPHRSSRQTVKRKDAPRIRLPPHWRHFGITWTKSDQSKWFYRCARFSHEDRGKGRKKEPVPWTFF